MFSGFPAAHPRSTESFKSRAARTFETFARDLIDHRVPHLRVGFGSALGRRRGALSEGNAHFPPVGLQRQRGGGVGGVG